uniref:Apple domain-containing protein n=1 Tax=Panagrolaimus sp. ES5 TaxID=591445 RepID=A0AC34FYP4_9BILA
MFTLPPSRPITTTSTPRSLIFATIVPSTPLRMSTTSGFPFITTTTPKNMFESTRTTVPWTMAPTAKPYSTVCNIGGFQQLSANADTSMTKSGGSFGGYFKTRVACQQLCKRNYQEKCLGYMFEPKNRGTCTIYQYLFNTNIYNSPNSKAVLFKNCNAPTHCVEHSPQLLQEVYI